MTDIEFQPLLDIPTPSRLPAGVGGWQVTIVGTPAPKGSMKPLTLPDGRTVVVDDDKSNKNLRRWRNLIKKAGTVISRQAGTALISSAVSVEAYFTIARAATGYSSTLDFPWKQLRHHGDLDKLARALLDGITDSELWTDDAQVCELHAYKGYPNSPGWPGPTQAGARIRIWPTNLNPPET